MGAVVVDVDETDGTEISVDLDTDHVGRCQRDLGPVVGGECGIDKCDRTCGLTCSAVSRRVYYMPVGGGPGFFAEVDMGLLEQREVIFGVVE